MPRVYYRPPLIKSLDRDLQQLEITMYLTGRLFTFLNKLNVKAFCVNSRLFADQIRHLHNRAARARLPDID